MNLNKAIIVGRMTRDPELKKIPNGTAVVSFSLATSRVYKNKEDKKMEETEFHNCVAFGRTAEIIGQYLVKGQLVLIEGRIQTRSWDAEGVKKYRTEIMVESMQMGPKAGGASTGSTSTEKVEKKQDINAYDDIEYPEDEINPDDIPF